MRKLTLLRHAKSSWTDSAAADIDRPLAPRGHKAALKIGSFIADNTLSPDLILCSPARRTRETLAHIRPFFKGKPEIRLEHAIYSAGLGDGIIAYLQTLSEPAHVMVIGHNPTLQHMALALAKPDSHPGYAAIERKYPTAGLAHIEFDIDRWIKLETRGRLVHYIVPKELMSREKA